MKTIKKKDWVGNKKSIFVTLASSNHCEGDREENDFYATDPRAMEILLSKERFAPRIWECACGGGHLSKVLEKYGYEVMSTDLIYRGYGSTKSVDFLKEDIKSFNGDIITNPPYKFALEFTKKALEIVKEGSKVAMFLKLQFLEGKNRKKFFEVNPPKVVYVSSSRLVCAKNGEFRDNLSSAVAYAWFVWEKGFKGDPIIKWVN